MKGVVILYETMHELHRKNKSAVILRSILKNPMTRLNRLFVQQTLRMKGFSPKWCEWITSFIQGGHVGIRVNDQTGNNF